MNRRVREIFQKALGVKVVDFEIERGPVASGPLKNAKDGFHYATSAISSCASDAVTEAADNLPLVSPVMASRMTAEVRWMTSRLSAKSAAFPAYI